MNTNNDNNNTNNDRDSTADFSSNDPPIKEYVTLSLDNELLLSMVFPHHSIMVNYFQEYAIRKGFLPVDNPKQCFTTEEFSNFFQEKAIPLWN
jgi:hypothetical protein